MHVSRLEAETLWCYQSADRHCHGGIYRSQALLAVRLECLRWSSVPRVVFEGTGDSPFDTLPYQLFPLDNFRSSITLLWSAYHLDCSPSLERRCYHTREPDMAVYSLPTLLLALFIQSTWSQQLQGPPMGMPYNLSASCTQALNTSVACPGALADVAAK